jgi:hypothetical protein
MSLILAADGGKKRRNAKRLPDHVDADALARSVRPTEVCDAACFGDDARAFIHAVWAIASSDDLKSVASLPDECSDSSARRLRC